jgi:general secretion pathway protein C
MPGRFTEALGAVLQGIAQPERLQLLRRVLIALLVIWTLFALIRLFWALVPVGEPPAEAPVQVINPIVDSRVEGTTESVDIDRMIAWHLFGEAGAAPEVVPVVVEEPAANSRDGIEEGARESRLKLVLRGIVASTRDGLGHAIIEHKNKQAVYAVEDKLPVPGRVVLAKVMPRQVVIDNGGTYELLTLFDDSKIATPTAGWERKEPVESEAPARQVDMRNDPELAALAAGYKQRLYQNPQSLAKVVSVSAVREDGSLLGYRVRPGQDKEQFERLGFKTGDLVLAVNGVDLDNPANTMRLYNEMRNASEATFELQRGEERLTLSVSIQGGTPQ